MAVAVLHIISSGSLLALDTIIQISHEHPHGTRKTIAFWKYQSVSGLATLDDDNVLLPTRMHSSYSRSNKFPIESIKRADETQLWALLVVWRISVIKYIYDFLPLKMFAMWCHSQSLHYWLNQHLHLHMARRRTLEVRRSTIWQGSRWYTADLKQTRWLILSGLLNTKDMCTSRGQDSRNTRSVIKSVHFMRRMISFCEKFTGEREICRILRIVQQCKVGICYVP